LTTQPVLTLVCSSPIRYEELPPNGGLPQTRVTYTQQIDLGGLIPKVVVNGQGVGQLLLLSSMRERFDQTSEIDRANRAVNIEMIANHADEYSAAEQIVCIDGEYLFEEFAALTAKALNMKPPLMKAEIAFKPNDNHAWGLAKTTVRATPEEVLAFMWDFMRRSSWREDDVEKSVEERSNDHNMVIYNHRKSDNEYIADRAFMYRIVWKKQGDGFIFVTSTETSANRPVGGVRNSLRDWRSSIGGIHGVVRGKYPTAMKIRRKNARKTTIEFVIHPDAGGRVPSFIFNRYIGSSLSKVTQIREYFQAQRGLEEWDADDARAVGEAMCIKTKAKKRLKKSENKQSAGMKVLFKQFKGLKEVADKYVLERSERMHHQRGEAISFTRACPVPLKSTFARTLINSSE